jgi:orotate phosphoribosyltransferase
MSNRTEREQLIDWLNLYSVRVGEEFTLSSEQTSNVYVDVKKTAMSRMSCKLLAKLLCEKMVQEFGMVEAVAGVVLGGCHLASIVAMEHPLGINVVYVRDKAKEHGTKSLIEGAQHTWLQHVVILEDVLTTGQSAFKAAETLRKAQFDVKGVLAVVDRRANKDPWLGNQYKVVSLVNFEELTI